MAQEGRNIIDEQVINNLCLIQPFCGLCVLRDSIVNHHCCRLLLERRKVR